MRECVYMIHCSIFLIVYGSEMQYSDTGSILKCSTCLLRELLKWSYFERKFCGSCGVNLFLRNLKSSFDKNFHFLNGGIKLSAYFVVDYDYSSFSEVLSTLWWLGTLKDGIVPLQLMQDEGSYAIEGFPGVQYAQVFAPHHGWAMKPIERRKCSLFNNSLVLLF